MRDNSSNEDFELAYNEFKERLAVYREYLEKKRRADFITDICFITAIILSMVTFLIMFIVIINL